MKDRLLGFKMYRKIYSGETELEMDLNKKITSAYIAFIELTMEIIKYYLKCCCRKPNLYLLLSGREEKEFLTSG